MTDLLCFARTSLYPLVDSLRSCEAKHSLHVLYGNAGSNSHPVDVLTGCNNVDVRNRYQVVPPVRQHNRHGESWLLPDALSIRGEIMVNNPVKDLLYIRVSVIQTPFKNTAFYNRADILTQSVNICRWGYIAGFLGSIQFFFTSCHHCCRSKASILFPHISRKGAVAC